MAMWWCPLSKISTRDTMGYRRRLSVAQGSQCPRQTTSCQNNTLYEIRYHMAFPYIRHRRLTIFNEEMLSPVLVADSVSSLRNAIR